MVRLQVFKALEAELKALVICVAMQVMFVMSFLSKGRILTSVVFIRREAALLYMSILDICKSRFRVGSTRKKLEFGPYFATLIKRRGQIMAFSGVSDRKNDVTFTYVYQ